LVRTRSCERHDVNGPRIRRIAASRNRQVHCACGRVADSSKPSSADGIIQNLGIEDKIRSRREKDARVKVLTIVPCFVQISPAAFTISKTWLGPMPTWTSGGTYPPDENSVRP
jgi:hypothetical protein